MQSKLPSHDSFSGSRSLRLSQESHLPCRWVLGCDITDEGDGLLLYSERRNSMANTWKGISALCLNSTISPLGGNGANAGYKLESGEVNADHRSS